MTTNPQFIFVASSANADIDATHSVEKLEVGRDTDTQKNLTELRKGLSFDFSFIMSEEAIYQLRQAGHIN